MQRQQWIYLFINLTCRHQRFYSHRCEHLALSNAVPTSFPLGATSSRFPRRMFFFLVFFLPQKHSEWWCSNSASQMKQSLKKEKKKDSRKGAFKISWRSELGKQYWRSHFRHLFAKAPALYGQPLDILNSFSQLAESFLCLFFCLQYITVYREASIIPIKPYLKCNTFKYERASGE